MKKISPFLIALLLLCFAPTMQSQVVINEVLSSNSSVLADENGSYEDWVELFNRGASTVNLNGYGLSDDAAVPLKWTFPNVSIGAGQYLLIWCSDKNRRIPGSPLHTNFKITSGGEAVVLSTPAGVLVNNSPAMASTQNMSIGRSPNGTGNFLFFAVPTPNAANTTPSYSEALTPPVFSHSSGFVTAGFTLTISTDVPGASIIYTLDGSEPKSTNLGGTTYSYKNQYPEIFGQVSGPLLTTSFQTLNYTGPIAIADRSALPNKLANISTTFDADPSVYIPANPIYKGTVVRAKVIKPGALDSQTITRSYFVSPAGTNRFSLPVVSISIDENKFFDYNNGIYVAGIDFETWRAANPTQNAEWSRNTGNFWRTGIANEKVGNLSYLVNGTEVLNQDAGFRIHGGVSRKYQLKSLNVYARSEYGKNSFDYPLFNDLNTDEFSSFVLRNSGGDFRNTMFRDALNQAILKSFRPDKEAYQPTVSFVNGEFWGILNLRDRYSSDYFKRTYNAEEVDYLETNGTVQEGDNVKYTQLMNYLTANSLATPANYDYIKTQVDPENFADYYIGNIFMLNEDWLNNNVNFWRNKVATNNLGAAYGLDGRWRWGFHDMDNTMGYVYDEIDTNNLAIANSFGTASYNPEWSTRLFRRMLENTEFKNYFINRFADALNTTFLPARTIGLMQSMRAVIFPTIPEHIGRWNSPEDLGDYSWYMGYQTGFFNQRPDFQRNHIRSVFNITANINATLDVSGSDHGYIKMNTIDIKQGTDGITSYPYPWTGIYFASIPVKLKAIAYPGYVFSHWTGASSSTNPEITITSASSFSVTAVYMPEAAPSSHPIYAWFMNSAIANNEPLTSLTSTYKTGATDGVLTYQSCLSGYPFTSASSNWRKASMERRNSPTEINYYPEVNDNLPFASSDMKGLQIREPLQSGTALNTMVYSFSTSGYKDIQFTFAAINELTNATGILVDYATNAGTPSWQTAGLASSTLALTNGYQSFMVDFANIPSSNNNPDFKVRLRFSGNNMQVDAGNRVTFNNITVNGTLLPLAVADNNYTKFSVFPNPVNQELYVSGASPAELVRYHIYAVDGKLMQKGEVTNGQIFCNQLSKGLYFLQLESNGKTETKKIIKD
jgi:hypothetical protein